MLQKGKTRKTFEYFLEFFIVILGICIAFWLGEQAEKAKENRLEDQYLADLQEDIETDLDLIEYLNLLHQSKTEHIQKAVDFLAGRSSNLSVDSIPTYVQDMITLDLFYPDDFTYGSLRQSGDFKLVKSQDIKKHLVRLYSSYESIEKEQNDLKSALDNNFFPMYFKNFNTASEKIINRNYFKSSELASFMVFTLERMNTISVYYERSQTIAEQTLALFSAKD